ASGSLLEQRAHAIEQTLLGRAGAALLAGRLCELFDQCALPGGELGRHLDLDVHQVVAARRRLARGLRDAAAADPEHPARLRALRDAHLDGAVERGDLEHGAQRRLREADRVLAAHVDAVAAEHAVLGDAQADVEIARTGPALAGFAFALERLD